MATERENEVRDRRWIRFFWAKIVMSIYVSKITSKLNEKNMQGDILWVAELKSAIRLVQLFVFHDLVAFKWPYEFTHFWGALEPLMPAEGGRKNLI
mgnify:CR=1 FL=1|jgi:hypothetical protein